MAVCDLCKGTGRLLKPWYDTTGLMTGFTGDICFKCDGKGTIVESLTEQEWLQTATTEQLAEWIKGHMNCNFCPMRLKCEDMRNCMEHIKSWLKQPHTTEVEK